MARGKEAQKRYNEVRKARRTTYHGAGNLSQDPYRTGARRNVSMKSGQVGAERTTPQPPVITEADLLSFQLAHFGDDTCPETWFVDVQTALEYDPTADFWGEGEEEEDDGLGWYEDGVKRTLTDAQVEMFRHSEWEMMMREQRLAREGREGQIGDEDEDYEVKESAMKRANSFGSNASSMDDDLVGLGNTTHLEHAPTHSPSTAPAPTTAQFSGPSLPIPAFDSTKRMKSTMTKPSSQKGSHPKKKKRKEEIAYEERNKRNWEEHVVVKEPVKGTWMYASKTENRVLREMDEVKAESVELDY